MRYLIIFLFSSFYSQSSFAAIIKLEKCIGEDFAKEHHYYWKNNKNEKFFWSEKLWYENSNTYINNKTKKSVNLIRIKPNDRIFYKNNGYQLVLDKKKNMFEIDTKLMTVKSLTQYSPEIVKFNKQISDFFSLKQYYTSSYKIFNFVDSVIFAKDGYNNIAINLEKYSVNLDSKGYSENLFCKPVKTSSSSLKNILGNLLGK